MQNYYENNYSKDFLVYVFYNYPAKLGYAKFSCSNLMSTSHDTYLPAKNLVETLHIFILSVWARCHLVLRLLVLFRIE